MKASESTFGHIIRVFGDCRRCPTELHFGKTIWHFCPPTSHVMVWLQVCGPGPLAGRTEELLKILCCHNPKKTQFHTLLFTCLKPWLKWPFCFAKAAGGSKYSCPALAYTASSQLQGDISGSTGSSKMTQAEGTYSHPSDLLLALCLSWAWEPVSWSRVYSQSLRKPNLMFFSFIQKM